MEVRQLLSTILVTTDDDNAPGTAVIAGSLRDAINQANAAPVGTVTTIDFAIGQGAQTIPLQQPLPTLANPIIIDGTTQSGYAGRPLIQVDGTQAGAGAIGFSLDDDSHDSTIKGLEITGFSGGGILDDNGNNNTFTNDVIGLHVVGTLSRAIANGTFGIEIADQANNNTLSNLVVAGNTYNGVVINNSTGNTLTGSLIGTDSAGTDSLDRNGVALGNGVAGGGGSGVVVNGGASNTTISNDVIVNNQSYGVLITGSGTTKTTLVGNKIGVDRTGTTALGNALDGVAILSGASGNFVGNPGQGNVISGNGHDGVWISGFDTAGRTGQNSVAGNFIGTNAAGSAAIPNTLDGVLVNNTASGNAIGTAVAGGGNVISGNSQWGVYISDAGTVFNVVKGDLIGTDVTGKSPVPNANNGVDIVYGAQLNTVGGTTAAARDLISGNLHEGVLIGFAGTSKNVVEGNFIGTDVTGKAFLAGQQQTDGVYVGLGAGGNTIGGQDPLGTFNTATWNVISGNSASGILVTDSGTTGTVISGNFIGTDVTGTAALPNGSNGVTIASGTSGTTVGAGTSSYSNLNVISGNLGDGVSIASSGNLVAFNDIGVDLNNAIALPNRGNGVSIHGASGNSVSDNVIRNNGGYGILTDSGSNHNAWYYDSLSNNAAGGIIQPTNTSLQPAPVLTSATVANGQTTVTGTITGSPYHNLGLVVQFYASPGGPTGGGVQGLTFIGQANATTDANGNASFTTTLNNAVPAGQVITATADYSVTSTSNFSNAVTVAAPAPTATASFIGTDTTTQGNWIGSYGQDGYDIAPGVNNAVAPKLPSYATVSLSASAIPFTWNDSGGNGPLFPQGPSGSGHVETAWYSATSFDINLNLTDGNPHRVSLYAVDWYGNTRNERIDVLDAGTGKLLDSRALSQFGNGVYLSWTLSGSVTLRVTNTGGPNALVNALYFGSPAASTATASFLAADTTTQGNWIGAYGQDGYDIAPGVNNAVAPKLPGYATVSLSASATPFTWNDAGANGPLFPQAPAGTGHIETAWYSATSFDINVSLTDGKPHRVALYAVDWYGNTRNERVDVIDTATGKVLDSRSLSQFGNGVYLSWNLTGSVTLRVTNTGGPNAVVNALYFG